MDIIKKDGKYYEITPVSDGFDIEREVGAIQDQIRDLETRLKYLTKLKDKNSLWPANQEAASHRESTI